MIQIEVKEYSINDFNAIQIEYTLNGKSRKEFVAIYRLAQWQGLDFDIDTVTIKHGDNVNQYPVKDWFERFFCSDAPRIELAEYLLTHHKNLAEPMQDDALRYKST